MKGPEPNGFRAFLVVRLGGGRGRLERSDLACTVTSMGKANGGHVNLLPGTARSPEPPRTHGFWSKTLSPLALEVADAVMEAPWACDMDRLGAEENGKLVSAAEELDPDRKGNARLGRGSWSSVR